MATYANSVESAIASALKCASFFIVDLEALSELVPHIRDEELYTNSEVDDRNVHYVGVHKMTKTPRRYILLKREIYQQLLIKWKALEERESADKIVSEDRAEREKAEEAAAAEIAAAEIAAVEIAAVEIAAYLLARTSNKRLRFGAQKPTDFSRPWEGLIFKLCA